MQSSSQIMTFIGMVVVAGPFLATAILGISSILDRKLSEAAATRLLQAAVVAGLLGSVVMLASMLALGVRHVAIDLGTWVEIPRHYHFSVKFVFDRLSVPMVILSFTLSGTIGAFASNYLHRDRGFNRFFLLYSVFLLGMVVASLAGTIETLFTGWELVGLSSAMLVAYFQERPGPARNGLWVWVVYRVSDAALLLAAVAMHHLGGEGHFDVLLGTGYWPDAQSLLTGKQALIVGLLLVAAASGKSALIPFSGWLPRAMEGPTPSSAVFYGALSVHLGAFLLLRVSPIIERSPVLSALVVALGLSTALLAYLAGSVQADIKAALSFASLSQVGIIVAEIGLSTSLVAIARMLPPADGSLLAQVGRGVRYVALIHLLGHACLRTLQFIRAPTLLQDYNALENAIGDRLPPGRVPWARMRARRAGGWLYRLALHQGYLDAFLSNYVVVPFVRTFRWFDGLERRWTDFLAGEDSRESDPVKPQFGPIEELS
jgi:NADH-quinone oxidoreductase subunit L